MVEKSSNFRTSYRHMMVLLGQSGITERDDRLHLASKILGRNITSFTLLDKADVHAMIDALSNWRMLQEFRLDTGVLVEDSLLVVEKLCNIDSLLSEDNSILPNESSRKNLRKVLMSSKEPRFATPDMDSIDAKLKSVLDKNPDMHIVEDSAQHGRWSSSDVIPAPTTSLGLALGIGGIPRGKVIHLWGVKHGGKTMMANHFIAESQKVGIPTVLLDAEAASDGSFMENLGVNMDMLRIVQPTDLESLSAAIRSLATSGALIVVDSIAASESSAEIERDLQKSSARVGGNAALWKSTLSLFRPLARKYGTTLIMINQMRSNFNAGMMGDPYKAYGSESIQHNSDISMRVSAVKEQKDSLKKNGYKISRVRFDKNRFNGTLSVIDLPFKPGFPYNKTIDLVRCCSELIDAGSDITYGELSHNAIIADTLFDDANGEYISKKNRFSIAIDPMMMSAILHDDPDFDEVDIAPIPDYNYEGNWTVDNPAPDVDVENSTGFTLPGVGEINAVKWLKNHPAARDLISERILNSLNRKEEFTHEI